MKAYKFGLLFVIVLSSSYQQPVFGQPVGSPALTKSHREFTLSFCGGYFQKEIYGVENRSSRFLAKGILGIANRLDIFVAAGASKLTLSMTGTTPVHLEDKYRLAFGGGFAWRYLSFERARLALFLNAQVFRVTSNPSSTIVTDLVGTQVSQSLALKYDWRELLLSSGFMQEVGVVNLMGGARVNLTQRLETKIMSDTIDGNSGTEIREKGEFRSGPQLNPFLGIEFKLPARYLLSCEISGRSQADYAFYVGLSQTGKP